MLLVFTCKLLISIQSKHREVGCDRQIVSQRWKCFTVEIFCTVYIMFADVSVFTVYGDFTICCFEL